MRPQRPTFAPTKQQSTQFEQLFPSMDDSKRQDVRLKLFAAMQRWEKNLSQEIDGAFSEREAQNAVDLSVQIEEQALTKFADSQSTNYHQLTQKIVQSVTQNKEKTKDLFEHTLQADQFVSELMPSNRSNQAKPQSAASNPFGMVRPPVRQNKPPISSGGRGRGRGFGNMYASAMPTSMPATQMKPEEEEKTNPFQQHQQQQEVNQASSAPSNEFDFFNDIASAVPKKQQQIEPIQTFQPEIVEPQFGGVFKGQRSEREEEIKEELKEEAEQDPIRELNSNQQNAAEVAMPSNSAQEEQQVEEEEIKGQDDLQNRYFQQQQQQQQQQECEQAETSPRQQEEHGEGRQMEQNRGELLMFSPPQASQVQEEDSKEDFTLRPAIQKQSSDTGVPPLQHISQQPQPQMKEEQVEEQKEEGMEEGDGQEEESKTGEQILLEEERPNNNYEDAVAGNLPRAVSDDQVSMERRQEEHHQSNQEESEKPLNFLSGIVGAVGVNQQHQQQHTIEERQTPQVVQQQQNQENVRSVPQVQAIEEIKQQQQISQQQPEEAQAPNSHRAPNYTGAVMQQREEPRPTSPRQEPSSLEERTVSQQAKGQTSSVPLSQINQNPFTTTQSPSVQGFIQSFQSSRPPQSVASVNLTNFEDGEALVRGYKKKKRELEELKDAFYRLETEYFTEKQRTKLLSEDLEECKEELYKNEQKMRKEQLKKQENNMSGVSKQQYELKQKESQAYQKELQNAKQENQKLKDKVKQLMRIAVQQEDQEDRQDQKQGNQKEVQVLKDQVAQLIRENHQLKNQNQKYQEKQRVDQLNYEKLQQELQFEKMTQKNLREQIEANQEAYERKLKYSNSEINDLQQKLDSMVNPITGEMSFEERAASTKQQQKMDWKKEEVKDKSKTAPIAAKIEKATPVVKKIEKEEEEVKVTARDYFAEDTIGQKTGQEIGFPEQKEEKALFQEPTQEISAANYFNEPITQQKQPEVQKQEVKPVQNQARKQDYGFALDELEDVDFNQKKEAEVEKTGGVIPNSLFD